MFNFVNISNRMVVFLAVARPVPLKPQSASPYQQAKSSQEEVCPDGMVEGMREYLFLGVDTNCIMPFRH